MRTANTASARSTADPYIARYEAVADPIGESHLHAL
jgi:hypothetical protein